MLELEAKASRIRAVEFGLVPGLLHPVAPADIMLGQLHRLMGTIGIPNVRFGVLPARRRLPYWPTEGYWMVDQLVIVEWLGEEQQVTDPDQVAVYHEVTDLLWTAAIEGDEARALLLRLSDEYRADS